MNIPSRLLTIGEAKTEYRYSHSGIYRDIAAGKIEAIKRGRSTLIVRESVERALASQPRLGAQAAA